MPARLIGEESSSLQARTHLVCNFHAHSLLVSYHKKLPALELVGCKAPGWLQSDVPVQHQHDWGQCMVQLAYLSCCMQSEKCHAFKVLSEVNKPARYLKLQIRTDLFPWT